MNIESADYTQYEYNINVLSLVGKYNKNYSDGTLKFLSRISYTYFPNLFN